MTLQHDLFLEEIHISFTFLTKMNDVLLPLNLPGSLVGQVIHLVRIVTMKN